jgi:Cytochrome c biogenesis factor
MADKSRVFSKGELAGAVVAALAVGFFMGSMFMELRQGANQPPAMSMQQGGPAADMPGAQGGMPPEAAAQIRDLEIATAQKPGDQGAWIDLANLYFDAHQPQKSVAAYEKAVALGPVSPDVWTDYGSMLREAGQAKKAVESFDAALKQNPKHQNALFNKGVVQLHDLKDRAGALATWEQLLQVNPEAKNPDGRAVKDMVAELKKG